MSLCEDIKTTVIYGFEFVLPDNTFLRDFINELYKLNFMLKTPFQISGIMSSFDPMMCHSETCNMMTSVVLGFTPHADLAVTAELFAELKEYKDNTAVFENYTFKDASFFCGIEWVCEDTDAEDLDEDDIDTGESESESESEESEESESEETFDFDEIPMQDLKVADLD
jgi:hypothetical protein